MRINSYRTDYQEIIEESQDVKGLSIGNGKVERRREKFDFY